MSLKRNPISKSYKIKVGITIGDPSGIGPAVVALALNKLKGLAEFIIITDKWVFDKVQSSNINVKSFRFIDLKNVSRRNFRFGKVSAEYGRASIEYLEKALDLIKSSRIDCLVTAPVSKEALNLAGFRYSGHTEYLAAKTKTKNIAMMLLNKDLKLSLVTRHLPLKDVPLNLNQRLLSKNILLAHKALKELFLINNPRIVVCGLNPHASDNGLLGNEENRIIKPALKELRKKNLYIDGPLSADVAIYKTKNRQYDCAIAMYHDQALIPLKLLGSDSGVNLTLGLPFVRTSPLHGTAFDIAASPSLIRPNSFIEAVRIAVQCTANLKKA
jgi:4-hydroxythreonine-4-phosphate dehydrogenase